MLRLLKLELGKIFKPVITTTAILTVLTCILTCVLQRDYTVYFHIDAWEIGTEYIALLFPLFVVWILHPFYSVCYVAALCALCSYSRKRTPAT